MQDSEQLDFWRLPGPLVRVDLDPVALGFVKQPAASPGNVIWIDTSAASAWHDNKYGNMAYFGTLFGAMAMVAAMAELWREFLPPWLLVGIAITPLVIFSFAEPRVFFSDRIVRHAHALASLWYIAAVVVIWLALWSAAQISLGLVVLYALFATPGIATCIVILAKLLANRYGRA
jgi:hypothetical protein